MSKYTLFIGARRSGKTYRAIEEARRVGPRVLVIALSTARAASIAEQYCVFAVGCLGVPMNKPDAIVIEHVEKMSVKAVLDAIAAAVDRDAPIWATAHPPSTVEGAKVIDALLAAGFVSVHVDEPPASADQTRFAELAKVIQPWATGLHAALGEVTADGEPIRFAPDATVPQ